MAADRPVEAFPGLAVEELGRRAEHEDTAFDAEDAATVEDRLYEFLAAAEASTATLAERRAERWGVDPEEFFALHARLAAIELADAVAANVRAEGREAVPPGDVSVALLWLDNCRFWPFCVFLGRDDERP